MRKNNQGCTRHALSGNRKFRTDPIRIEIANAKELSSLLIHDFEVVKITVLNAFNDEVLKVKPCVKTFAFIIYH